MLNKKLKIYFYICITVFFILLALVLFYSFGYKYDFKNRETFQIGAIIIKATPKDTTIYLDDKLSENNNTLNNLFTGYFKIENLNSGKYNLKIKKEKYFDWEKNINVTSGYITEFKNVVLLKNNYEKNILKDNLTTNLEQNNIWIGNKKNKIIYRNKNNLNLFDLDLKIIANLNNILFKENAKDDVDSNLANIIWSNDDTKIIVKTSENNKLSWYLIDFENKNKITNLSFIFNEIPEVKNRYNFDFAESLFYLKNRTLYKFDYQKLVSKRILNNVSGFLIHGDSLYYFLKDDRILYVNDLNNLSKAKIISTMPDNFDTQILTRIIKSSDNAYLILSSSGELYLINKTNKITFVNSRVKNAFFTNHNERILYYNDHEIWIYYIKEKISQPSKGEFENELITRHSNKINNISLYKDEEHLFYNENNTFKFIEFDDRDKINIFDILKLENSAIFYRRDNNSIYYVENNKLIQIDLEEK